MRTGQLLLLGLALVGFVSEAVSDDRMLRVRALRAARRMAQSVPSPEVSSMRNTNFEGVWGGRYYFVPRASTCGTRLGSFDFRHLLLNKGGSGYLLTNHDGDFNGRSRDKGRRWDFIKSVTVGGRPASMAIVYQSLARNGNSAVTAAAINVRGGCLLAYGANAIRLAR